jgi:hypothetical protein
MVFDFTIFFQFATYGSALPISDDDDQGPRTLLPISKLPIGVY